MRSWRRARSAKAARIRRRRSCSPSRRPAASRRRPGWTVRVVPNKYPAFEHHEVVIHSPRHVRSLADLSDDELDAVAEAWHVRAAAADERPASRTSQLVSTRAAPRARACRTPTRRLSGSHDLPPLVNATRTSSLEAGCTLCRLVARSAADGSACSQREGGGWSRSPLGRAASPYELWVTASTGGRRLRRRVFLVDGARPRRRDGPPACATSRGRCP